MANKFVSFALIAIIAAAMLSICDAGDKGGDIIVLGGNGGFGGGGGGGGMPMVLSQGGKKKGSIIFLGRRRRSIAPDDYQIYQLMAPNAQQSR